MRLPRWISPNPAGYSRSNRLRLGFGLRALPRHARSAPFGIPSSAGHFVTFASAVTDRGRTRDRVYSSSSSLKEPVPLSPDRRAVALDTSCYSHWEALSLPATNGCDLQSFR